MNIFISIAAKQIFKKLIALQSFFFSRPIIDIDLINDPNKSFGRNVLSPTINQISNRLDEIIYHYEFHWPFKLRIKNNSSKTAYNLKLESIVKNHDAYLEKFDDLTSINKGELLEVTYIIRHKAELNAKDAEKFAHSFPAHLKKIEIILSYTNESRKIFYTQFIITKNSKINNNLLSKPKKPNH